MDRNIPPVNMEDVKNKEFDRSIEQMMNEASVQPPFGMWNRIASEIATSPAATVTGGAATGAVGGTSYTLITVVAGVGMLASSLLTAYFITSNSNEAKPVTTTEITTEPTTTFTPSVQLPPVVEESVVASTNSEEAPAPVKKATRSGYTHAVAIPERETTITARSYEATEINSLRQYGEAYVPTRSYSVIRVILDEELANQKEIKYRPKGKNKFLYGRINRRK